MDSKSCGNVGKATPLRWIWLNRGAELPRNLRGRVGDSDSDFAYAIGMLEGDGGIIFVLTNGALRWAPHGNR